MAQSPCARSSARPGRLRSAFSDRYVRRLTRLAFLAPEIVEAIVAGNQPPELTAEALAERIDLPLLWTAQEQALGSC
jgi:site-specific DNA recombinase